ncbi:major facilitator superfamily transporter [Thozetella sp. PMI_491]|nr:major facilitator superfamily transporter [Thozetella sp. PMI_491]
MVALNTNYKTSGDAKPADKKCEEPTNEIYGEEAKPTHDGDVAREWAAKFDNLDRVIRRKMSRKLLAKIDMHLLPFLIIMYMLNYLDRTNLAQARQGTLEKDLGMKGDDYNIATSILFVGYFLMQVPSNLLITRVRPSLYLGMVMAIWGAVSTCNSFVHSFSSLVVVRFLLGFVEAPFFPGAVFLMSSWYTRAELTRRISWLYAGNALAQMFGGLISAAILGNLNGSRGTTGWRWLFIIEGSVTIFVAIVAASVLPNYPHTTRWLNEEEKAFAAWRLMQDIREEDTRHARSVWVGVKLAVQDYRLPIFVVCQHLSLLGLTFQYFFPAIVNTLGFGPITTLLLTVPPWVATLLTSLLVTWTSAKFQDRSIHIIVLMIVSALGNAIATGTTNTGARFFALFLIPMGSISAYTVLVSWTANSFPRPLVKRAACIAIANMFGNAGNIYGPYMYPASDSPRFIPGGTANTIICLLTAVVAGLLRWIHIRENKKLEQAEVVAAATGYLGAVEDQVQETRAPGFRYIL